MRLGDILRHPEINKKLIKYQVVQVSDECNLSEVAIIELRYWKTEIDNKNPEDTLHFDQEQRKNNKKHP